MFAALIGSGSKAGILLLCNDCDVVDFGVVKEITPTMVSSKFESY